MTESREPEFEPQSWEPKYPAGTPEYDAYKAELAAELEKWKNHEPPYELEEWLR